MQEFKMVDPATASVDDEVLFIAERQNPDGTTDVMVLVEDEDGYLIETEFGDGSNSSIQFQDRDLAELHFKNRLK